MQQAKPNLRPRQPIPLRIVVTLFLGILFSIGIFLILRNFEYREVKNEVRRRADANFLAFSALVSQYEQIFQGIQRFFQFDEAVSETEFHGMSQELLGSTPGLLLLAWAPRVPHDQLDDFLLSHPDLPPSQESPVRPKNPHPGQDYFPILFSSDISPPIQGIDLSGNPRLLELIRIAHEKKLMQATPLDLPFGNFENPPWVTLICPAYKASDSTSDINAPPPPLLGVILGVVSGSKILNSHWNAFPDNDLSMLAIQNLPTHPNPSTLFYPAKSEAHIPEIPSREEMTKSIHIEHDFIRGSLNLKLIFRPTKDWYYQQFTLYPWMALLLGIAFTLLLCSHWHDLNYRSLLVQEQVQEKTSELLQTTQKLQESENRYFNLLNSIQGIVWEADPETYDFIFVSSQAADLLKFPVEQWYQPGFLKNLIHPDDLESTLNECRELTDKGQDHTLRFRVVSAEGKIFWIEDFVSVESLANHGRILRGIMLDITEKIQTAAEREQMEIKLRETQKLESLGILAGGIAHDFNNILTGIMGNASLANLQLPPNHAAFESLDQIEKSSLRAAELCKQLLAYAGKGRFLLEHVNLSAIVNDSTDLIQVSLSKKTQLHLNLSNDLPCIHADPTQLRQIVMNLVINASDALGDRDGHIRVTTQFLDVSESLLRRAVASTTLTPGKYIALQVCDDGEGMSPETVSKIFDPFFTTKITGRGLGLAAVLGIVKSHQGALIVNSKLGKGTEFLILFPPSNTPNSPSPTRATLNELWTCEGCILIVDDEPTVRQVTRQMLLRAGFQVEVAEHGKEAMAKIQANPSKYRLILLDLTMPQMDGSEVYKEILRSYPKLPVLLMSGFNPHEVIKLTKQDKEEVNFVQKPFNPRELYAHLRGILETPSSLS